MYTIDVTVLHISLDLHKLIRTAVSIELLCFGDHVFQKSLTAFKLWDIDGEIFHKDDMSSANFNSFFSS